MEQRAYMPQAKTTEHETPPDLFDSLDAEFGPFTLDPACQPDQHSAEVIYERGGRVCWPPAIMGIVGDSRISYDGLLQDWSGRVFLNRPYGREMPRWIEKAVYEVEAGHCELVVALIPSRTDTKMWQKYIVRSVGPLIDCHHRIKTVRFLPGRLHFSGQKDAAPFPSAVVVWAR